MKKPPPFTIGTIGDNRIILGLPVLNPDTVPAEALNCFELVRFEGSLCLYALIDTPISGN